MKPHSLIESPNLGYEVESQTLPTLSSPTRIISYLPSYMLLLSGQISAAAEILATDLDDVTLRRVHTAAAPYMLPTVYPPLYICAVVGAAQHRQKGTLNATVATA